ncbi:patatin-like phospholipase family protein [Pseudoxanthomonas sp. 10H]|uniref:patatin-like phospholipase family protein n=1 Tax=Pseudoxanthomonas sp. 10H TaxID=3242729 RepID=UPI00355801C5
MGLAVAGLLAACGGTRSEAPPPAPVVPPPARVDPVVPPVRIGLALGGGAAKGFAHIGVIKMLEANGFRPDVVAGTSAGSVVGALYASGMDPFKLQERAVALDEASIRDVRLFSGGLVQGLKLQDYVNQSVDNKPIERMRKPFAAVATRLETGERTVFVRGNTGQAVRASSSVPGVFEPVTIGSYQYVDGGVVSPVPVDAARQLGADFVIAVDISSKASGRRPDGMLGIVNQSIAIMGQRLGEQELARADVVIRPDVLEYGSADFTRRNQAILEGEKAALAVLPQIRAAVQKLQAQRLAEARAAAARREAALAPAPKPACKDEGSRWNPLRRKDPGCAASN